MSKFASLALLGAQISASWSDLIESNQYQRGHESSFHHDFVDHSAAASSAEAKHLASHLGMDENQIYTDESNTLDQMAKAILNDSHGGHRSPSLQEYAPADHHFVSLQ